MKINSDLLITNQTLNQIDNKTRDIGKQIRVRMTNSIYTISNTEVQIPYNMVVSNDDSTLFSLDQSTHKIYVSRPCKLLITGNIRLSFDSGYSNYYYSFGSEQYFGYGLAEGSYTVNFSGAGKCNASQGVAISVYNSGSTTTLYGADLSGWVDLMVTVIG